MNFFEQQERARRNTVRLVVLMGLAVVSLIAISSIAVAAILAFLGGGDPDEPLAPEALVADTVALLDWTLVGSIAILVIGVVIAGSLFKHFQLRSGGKAVAESLGARPINPATTNFEERKVLNVVEEMAIASGIPVPPVYVMEDESINAFAAGHTPQDAVIGVTRGCIRLLTREELQGVVAHEFSHIFHGDMRLNTRLVATLNGILLIGLMGYIMLRSAPFRRGGNSRDNSVFIILAIGLVLVVVGFAGTFFGNLIKSAVSRQREFLADASAVQFTRNPNGIAGALKKIGGNPLRARLEAVNASEYSHMFFGQALSGGLGRLMATHPPLQERIRRVQSDWDGQFVVPQPAPVSQSELGPEAMGRVRNSGQAGPREVLGAAAAGAVLGSTLPAQQVTLGSNATREAINAIGQPTTDHVAYAQQTLAAIDPELRDAAHDIYSARALIYGLLLDPSEDVRAKQLRALEQHAEPDTYEHVKRLMQKLVSLDPRLRLPLVELSLPALKQLSDRQDAIFKNCLEHLIAADNQVSLMEWALHRIIVHNTQPPPGGLKVTRLAKRKDESEVLVSALAYAGTQDQAAAQEAFEAAAELLPFEDMTILPRDSVKPAALEKAVTFLAKVVPADKRRLLEALGKAVEHDGVVAVKQAELLRAIADSLHTPLPPLLAQSR